MCSAEALSYVRILNSDLIANELLSNLQIRRRKNRTHFLKDRIGQMGDFLSNMFNWTLVHEIQIQANEL